MPRVLSLKKIKGKKEQAHPNSRKANQIQRAALRDERISAATTQRSKEHMKFVNRIGFFKIAAMSTDSPTIDDAQARVLVQTYIDRNKGEQADLAAARRPGRPKSSREDQLQMLYDVEMSEFRSGFKIPDLLDDKNVAMLKAWPGDYGGLQKINMRLLQKEAS
jgi:translation machinery-associated protein 16